MAWRQLFLLSCLSAVLLLSILPEGTAVAVGTRRLAAQEVQEGECRGHPGGSRGSPGEHVPVVTGFSRVSGVEGKIFMQESDALNFLKKRGRRSLKPREEVNAENRQKLQADELRREHLEEQRNESENFAEEQNDEQEERSREAIEQWREWHSDGLYPPYLYNRHHV
ncbi:unique cartilage matrix-associated protein isoform X1 [Physeter macrocephalus]|uniref:Unique cartilage matrix-associated protein n=1 Tax=Physeter macrocephalus TaxID=9755 RepID=A0A455BU17_PHYMC|nr:unique cartilage matrix-associated protein isoform X1 [Physeter catodon]|eukprot:XP_028351303.1 unique cartilage matrix-associated protein isoform X1 [Physeter catodon]